MSGVQALPRRGGEGADPYKLGHGRHGPVAHDRATGHGEGGPASKRVVVGFGFWIFLLSDIVMFSAFFATYAVLRRATAGGPGGGDIFEGWRVATETGLLLISSFTCGMAGIASRQRSVLWTEIMLAVTALFGLGFLALEATEFAGLIARGAGPERSAFLSAFFTVVGCHGLHVTSGLIWLSVMMMQVFFKGFRPNVVRRLLCFSLFWHALDIIWVALFTVVYLIGAGA